MLAVIGLKVQSFVCDSLDEVEYLLVILSLKAHRFFITNKVSEERNLIHQSTEVQFEDANVISSVNFDFGPTGPSKAREEAC